jgi:hypothetical protein
MGRIALPNGEVTEPNESQFHSPTEIVAYYARDLEFVIGQIDKLNRADREKTFIDRFDMQRIAAIGHSSGFVAASGACKLDSRIKACINIDAPGFGAGDLAGLEQPLLWIRLQKASAVPAEYLKAARTMVYELQIVGANHGSVEDWDYLKATSAAQREAAGKVLEIIRQHLEAFLSQNLNRQNSDPLEPGSGKPGIRWRVYSPAISGSETQGSRVEGYAYISPHSPRIRVNVDRSFDYVGNVPFTIDNVAAGNRYVFVHTSRDKHVQRMFIIQQEAFLPSSNDTYKYRITNPVKLGSFEYQHSVEIYDNVAAIREEPGKEGDATKRFLEAQGLSLDQGSSCPASPARPADLRHKHEIIFFCYENLSSYGHKLTDFREGTDSADKQNIKRKVDENCRSAFQVTD